MPKVSFLTHSIKEAYIYGIFLDQKMNFYSSKYVEMNFLAL
jgi:hypothetical protein